MRLQKHPSPNQGPRRNDARPDLIVLHYTAMGSADAACTRLCDPDFEVSSHYLIGRDGCVFQLVEEDCRAWHAGAGRWGDVDDVNSRSIGIELDNDGSSPFSAQLMDSLEELLPQIMVRHDIMPSRIIGHSDMTPMRKSDPGARFDWQRLARQGLSVWPQECAAQPPSQFRHLAQTFGYSANVPDEALLAAFRLRFRPGATGPLDHTDMALLTDLAARFPVDRTGAKA